LETFLADQKTVNELRVRMETATTSGYSDWQMTWSGEPS